MISGVRNCLTSERQFAAAAYDRDLIGGGLLWPSIMKPANRPAYFDLHQNLACAQPETIQRDPRRRLPRPRLRWAGSHPWVERPTKPRALLQTLMMLCSKGNRISRSYSAGRIFSGAASRDCPKQNSSSSPM